MSIAYSISDLQIGIARDMSETLVALKSAAYSHVTLTHAATNAWAACAPNRRRARHSRDILETFWRHSKDILETF